MYLITLPINKELYIKILELDIETAPNTAHVWGLFKQNVALSQLQETSYVLCWAAKWYGKPKVMFSSIYHNSEKQMLKEIHKLLDEADAVIHYNGKRFDIPTLNKEFIIQGMLPPTPYHQIDLLHVAKRRFRFVSNKLDHVAEMLGVGKKIKHEGHQLWVKCMNNDPLAWKKMKRYNIQDVKLLEEVYNKMLPWIQNHPNHGLYTDEERPVCTNCGGTKVVKRGTETTLTGQYQRYSCSSCGTPLRGRTTQVPKERRAAILTQSKL